MGLRLSCGRSATALIATGIRRAVIVEDAVQCSFGLNNNLDARLSQQINTFSPLPFNAPVEGQWIDDTH